MQEKENRFPRWDELPDLELYMDQLVSYIQKHLSIIFEYGGAELTQSMVNNYVKIKILPSPIKKKYTKEHISLLFVICTLKQVLSISEITSILSDFEAVREKDGYNAFCQVQENAILLAKTKVSGLDKLLKSEIAINMAASAVADKAATINLLKFSQ